MINKAFQEHDRNVHVRAHTHTTLEKAKPKNTIHFFPVTRTL